MDRSTLDMAVRIDRALARGYEQYLEACEGFRREGYRPQTCEHGTNQWTDYDNICGPCEDGLSMGDPLFRRGYAIAEAKHKHQAIRDLLSAGFLVQKELAKVNVEFDLAPIWKRMTEIMDSCDQY